MEILVDEHLLSLRVRELADVVKRCVAQPRVARAVLDLVDPMAGLVLQGVEAVGLRPEPREQADQHVERVRRLGEERSRLCALEHERPALVVSREQTHRTITVPALECVRLLLRLAVRNAELEDGARSVREYGRCDEATGTRCVLLSDLQQPPLLRATLRYARSDPRRPPICAGLTVRERRQLRANVAQPRAVELGDDHGLLVWRLRKHGAPRIDDQRPPVGRLAGDRLADLTGRRDVELVLDRPRAQQHDASDRVPSAS